MGTASASGRARLDAPIVEIVVYPAGARVTRRGRVTLARGGPDGHQVVLDGLPWELQADSVRVAGRGPARLLGVDVAAQARPEPADEAGVDLAARRLALTRELSAVIDEDDGEQARRGFLDVAARTGAAALARSWSSVPPPVGTDPARNAGDDNPASTEGFEPGRRLSAAADALAGQLAGVHARRRALAERREEIERRIGALDRTILARRQRRDPDTRAVLVDLELIGVEEPGATPATPATPAASAPADAVAGAASGAASGGGGAEGAGEPGAVDGVEVELEVSYLVATAGWQSGYDVRLDGERVTLTWFAMVVQSSGEDWPPVELILSTARPARHARLPELDPHYVDIHRPAPPAAAPMEFAARPMMAAAPRRGAAAPGGSGAPPEEPMSVAMAAAPELSAAGTATYRPPRRVAVPADGAPHRTTVTAIDLDAVLDYLTVPKISPDAYLRATVTNTSPHTLLPGKISIFHGQDFVGTGAIQIVPPGAEVELQLGVDDRVRVERELVRRSTGKRVVGNNRRTDVGYRIEVTNHTPRRIRVAVRDQIPVSRHESVVVRDVQALPAPAERTELGLLSWLVELAPGATGQVEFSFRLEHPKGQELAGWRE